MDDSSDGETDQPRKSKKDRAVHIIGGGRGIRTPDRSLSSYNGLANRRLQPLGHPSLGGSDRLTRSYDPQPPTPIGFSF